MCHGTVQEAEQVCGKAFGQEQPAGAAGGRGWAAWQLRVSAGFVSTYLTPMCACVCDTQQTDGGTCYAGYRHKSASTGITESFHKEWSDI